MIAKVGDRILVESESVGQRTREGEILEVIEGEIGLRYRVRWVDGHESVFTPSGGSARIVPGGKPASSTKKKPASSTKKKPAKR
jgi:hypothetical protein